MNKIKLIIPVIGILLVAGVAGHLSYQAHLTHQLTQACGQTVRNPWTCSDTVKMVEAKGYTVKVRPTGQIGGLDTEIWEAQ